MKTIVFEEVAKLFDCTKLGFRLDKISTNKTTTVFTFYLDVTKWYFYVSTNDFKSGYGNRYGEYENRAYDILKENGYVK